MQWKRVIEIHIVDRGKTSHLLADYPTPVTDAWILDDNILLHHILITMKPKIQDLALHYITVKELSCFLWDLYEGRSNINRAYNIIQNCLEEVEWSAHESSLQRV